MTDKPTIKELEDILNGDIQHIELLPDGSIKTRPYKSFDEAYEKGRQDAAESLKELREAWKEKSKHYTKQQIFNAGGIFRALDNLAKKMGWRKEIE